MKIDDEKIKAILLREHYVTPEDIQKAEEFSDTHNAELAEYLLSQGILTKNLLGQAIAEALGVLYANVNTNPPSRDEVLRIPEEVAKTYRAVFFQEDEKGITVATDDPTRGELTLALVSLFPGKQVTLAYSLPEDLEPLFAHYQKPLETRFTKIIQEQKRIAPEIIDEVFKDALIYRASDVHFEPQEEEVVVRFRIDGVLHEAGKIPKAYYENLLNRIKVKAHLRIDEHFSAQDGALRYVKDTQGIDMRVSIIPTLDGEKIAIRILSEYVRSFNLGDLGLSQSDQAVIWEASKKPFGMILVTGPTGSGKTTTLYAILKILNRPEVNITTIEDPVEYKIAGVNQIKVNLAANLTFAKGLRSIIRQDPNIILVGEIRDKETSEIAVNAALTGHLLLSSFHANDAATAVPRLLDMGVEPFLLSSTLELIVAQRLVRKICETCRYSGLTTNEEIKKVLPQVCDYFSEKAVRLYKGKGCKACGDTGYKGRIGLFEYIKVTLAIKEIILKNPSAGQVWEVAQQEGSRLLFEDGIEKVKNGVTTLDEVLRVAKPAR